MRYEATEISCISHGSYLHKGGHHRQQCIVQTCLRRTASECSLSELGSGACQCKYSQLRAKLAFPELVDVAPGVIMQVCEPTVPWFGGQQQAHPHCRPQPAVAAQICNTQQLTHQLSNFPSFASNKVVKKMGQQLLSAPGTSHFAEVDFAFLGIDKTKNAWAILVDLNRQSTYVSGMCHVYIHMP
jgi:hypothetical protein